MERIECEEPWFSMLRNGTKRFTGRKNSPKYQNIHPDDTVELFCGNESFRAKVTRIEKYSSIEEYLDEVGLEKALPGVKTLQEGLKIYFKWSSPEEVKQWGFIAIYITLTD